MAKTKAKLPQPPEPSVEPLSTTEPFTVYVLGREAWATTELDPASSHLRADLADVVLSGLRNLRLKHPVALLLRGVLASGRHARAGEELDDCRYLVRMLVTEGGLYEGDAFPEWFRVVAWERSEHAEKLLTTAFERMFTEGVVGKDQRQSPANPPVGELSQASFRDACAACLPPTAVLQRALIEPFTGQICPLSELAERVALLEQVLATWECQLQFRPARGSRAGQLIAVTLRIASSTELVGGEERSLGNLEVVAVNEPSSGPSQVLWWGKSFPPGLEVAPKPPFKPGSSRRSSSQAPNWRDRREEEAKGLIFGSATPSAPAFVTALANLEGRTDYSHQQRRDLVTALNFWRGRLRVKLFFQGERCRISVKGTGVSSGFQLRTPSNKTVYAQAAFPPLSAELADSAATGT